MKTESEKIFQGQKACYTSGIGAISIALKFERSMLLFLLKCSNIMNETSSIIFYDDCIFIII